MKSPRHPIRPFPNGRQPNILRGAAANALAVQQAPAIPPARTTPQNGPSDLLEQVLATPGQKLDTPTIRGEGVHLYLGGDRWRLPAGVALAFGKARGREIAFVVTQPGQKVHILVSTGIDGICELTPVGDALAAAVRRIYFSRP